MRPLILTEESTAEARNVLRHAEAHVISWAELQAIATGALPPPGDNPIFACTIPMGYRCVFTHEMQRAIKFRHLSVSVDTPGKWPHEAAVDEIAKLFGFKNSFRSGKVIIDVDKATQSVGFIEPCE